jgi:GTPase
MSMSLEAVRPKTVLVAIQLPHQTAADVESSLAELGRLVGTLGFDVIGQVVQKRTTPHPGAGLGGGKLMELAQRTGGTGLIPGGAEKKKQRKDLHAASADPVAEDEQEEEGDNDLRSDVVVAEKATVVVVDNDLSPSQLRNLGRATGASVLDRASVIIEIFSRHARTKEAQMQVEIARLQYEAPRLRERQQVGADRGEGLGKGDSAAELDKRRIRDRIAELKEKLEAAQAEADHRRLRRQEANRVALVGYTNAGKSSLMRALTGSDVLVADKLFATLGTTVRAIPDANPRVLVSDTVGFIKNLPHALVASFKSTLDEAHEASLLLIVVDASDPSWRLQLEVTSTVLGEIGASDLPRWLVLNKIDRVDALGRAGLRSEFPHAIQLSALSQADVSSLTGQISDFFSAQLQDLEVMVSFARGGAASAMAHERLQVVQEEWTDEGLRLVVRGTPEDLAKLEELALMDQAH